MFVAANYAIFNSKTTGIENQTCHPLILSTGWWKAHWFYMHNQGWTAVKLLFLGKHLVSLISNTQFYSISASSEQYHFTNGYNPEHESTFNLTGQHRKGQFAPKMWNLFFWGCEQAVASSSTGGWELSPVQPEWNESHILFTITIYCSIQ